MAKKKKSKKGKKKKAVDPNAPTFPDVAKRIKVLIQRELEVKNVDRHPVVSQFDRWVENGNDPQSLIFNFAMEPIMVKVITQALIDMKWSRVKSISFWNADIGDVGAEHLARALPLLPSVFKLEIIDSCVGPGGARYLAALLADQACALKILRLDFNPLTSQGIEYLAQGVENNLSLKVLSLSYCSLTSTGAYAVSRMLSNFEGDLRELNLEGNDLRNTGILSIAASIGVAPKLTNLNISSNKFTGDLKVVMELSKSFRDNVNLAHINLDGNLIGSDGAAKFLEQLRECKHIRSFEVTPLVHPVTYALIIEWLVKNKPAKKGKKKKGKGKKKKKN